MENLDLKQMTAMAKIVEWASESSARRKPAMGLAALTSGPSRQWRQTLIPVPEYHEPIWC